MRTVRVGLLAVVLGLSLAGPAAVGESHLQPEADESGRIIDFDFAPRDFSFPVGTSVEWTNEGARPHTITDRGGTFDTGSIAPNGSGSVTFSVPGTYYFFCRINPGSMNGVITVEPGPEPAPVVRVQATDPAREGDALSFDPSELSVEAGTAVVLANVGGRPHSLTADDGSFDTGIVNPGAQEGRFAGSNASFVVPGPGTYEFHCVVHPEVMRGVLAVTGEERPDGPAPPSQAPREATIDMLDFDFEPAEASVAAGGTVTWRNAGEAPHTATFDDVDLDSDVVQPGAEGRLVAPAQPGSYSYRCNIHPDAMRGVLVVVGQNTADPTQLQAGDAVATGADVGGGITTLALITGVVGAFLGGFGISAFVRPRK